MPKMEIWAGVRGAKKPVRSYDKKAHRGWPFAPHPFKLGMCTADTCPVSEARTLTTLRNDPITHIGITPLAKCYK